ncbi:hypothetical protein MMC10_005739 [Thelotrema lepadinum]|nr:hypothetical protein [Thelotrema lepadinum]
MSSSTEGSRATSPASLNPPLEAGISIEYENAIRLYERDMKYQWSESIKPANNVALDKRRWYKYAALVNPRAAWEFERAAEEIHKLDPYDRQPDKAMNLPLEYLYSVEKHIVRIWQDIVMSWNTAEKPSKSTLAKCEMQCMRLIQSTDFLEIRLRRLNKYTDLESTKGEEVFIGLDVPAANPERAWRAVIALTEELRPLLDYSRETLDEMRGRYNYQQSFPAQDGLRRRKAEPVQGENVDADRSSTHGPASSGRLELSCLLDFRARFSQILSSGFHSFPSLSRRARALYLHQATVESVTFIFAVVGAMMMGIAVTQTRPQACETEAHTFDDGFWTLISQCLTQSMALYCTALPTIRDIKMPVPVKIWFWSSLWCSFALIVIAPILYASGIDWRVMASISYASGVTSLMANLLLARGVERVSIGANLGHVNHAE